MRGLKDSFICVKDHRSNSRHPREEITVSINLLKSKHPAALLTVEEFHCVLLMTQRDDDEDPEDDEDVAMWFEKDHDDEDGTDLAYMSIVDLKEV